MLGFSHFKKYDFNISFLTHFAYLKGKIYSKNLKYPVQISYQRFLRVLENHEAFHARHPSGTSLRVSLAGGGERHSRQLRGLQARIPKRRPDCLPRKAQKAGYEGSQIRGSLRRVKRKPATSGSIPEMAGFSILYRFPYIFS